MREVVEPKAGKQDVLQVQALQPRKLGGVGREASGSVCGAAGQQEPKQENG